ncbi:MAG: hypothetical protein L0170_00205 [Acidobacteria bacterium]|nr:hypothetical protein [Acidobacteriota bacterium]
MNSAAPWGRLSFVAAALLCILHPLRAFQSVISDDAFIAFRYARHLAQGLGLTWNPGEPPLEGFTSPLHILLLSAGIRVGLDPLTLSQILGLFGSLLACLAAAWIARELSDDDSRAAPLAALGLSLSTPLAAWSRGGLETTLFTGLLALAVAIWLRKGSMGGRRWLPALLFFLATLSRPEAVLIAGIAFGYDAFSRLRVPERRSAALQLGRDWFLYPTLMAVYLGWKLYYFGSLLPNTYYAKGGAGMLSLRAGVAYALRFFQSYGAVNLLLIVAALVFCSWPRKRALSFLLCSIALYTLHVIRIGGDYSYFGRYLVPTLPMLISLSAVGAILLWKRTSGLGRVPRCGMALVVLAASCLELAAGSLGELRDRPFLLYRRWNLLEAVPAPGDPFASLFRPDYIHMGKAIQEYFPPGRTVACLAVGAIGYYSDRPILDLLGINDRRIARLPVATNRFESWSSGHMKGSAQELLARRPDYAILNIRASDTPGVEPSDEIMRKYPFVDDLLKSPRFRAEYHLESCALPDGRWMNFYRRDDAPRVTCRLPDPVPAPGITRRGSGWGANRAPRRSTRWKSPG